LVVTVGAGGGEHDGEPGAIVGGGLGGLALEEEVIADRPGQDAHELGHLSVARSPGGRLLQAGRGLQALKPFATMGSALHPTRTGRLLSAVAGAATTLPRNYDEHKAWEHGEELLQQHGITDAQRVESDAVKRRALSSYWLDTADTLVNNLGVMGLREGYDYWRRSR
jgi:hypothetical protein